MNMAPSSQRHDETPHQWADRPRLPATHSRLMVRLSVIVGYFICYYNKKSTNTPSLHNTFFQGGKAFIHHLDPLWMKVDT
jgi:hypothetical protein